MVEIFGPEASGKTTLVYHVLAEAQKQGGICAFIDAEHAMDPEYAKRIGVDVDELLVSQPDHGEQALEIADLLIRSGTIDVVAIDSVAALTPKVELEGAMGDQSVGLQARMMSQAMRKLAGNLNRANTLCVLTNQIREKVGVMFGSPETQPGGRALKFYSSQRLDIRRIETLKEGTEAVGNRVRVKVVKNKVAAPFRQAEFDIEYGQGISTEGCLIDLGIENDIVTKSGSFFSYGDERLGQGRNNAKGYLRENPKMAKEIEAKIYDAVGVEQNAVPVPLAVADADPGSEAEPEEEKAACDGAAARKSAPSSWPTGRCPRATARSRRCARGWSASASRPRRSITRSTSSRRPGSSTTPASLSASRRTSAASTSGGRSGSSATCCGAGCRLRSWRGSRRTGAGVRARCSARPPGTASGAADSERDRDKAWRLLVRKGYEPDLAYDAVRAHGARRAA